MNYQLNHEQFIEGYLKLERRKHSEADLNRQAELAWKRYEKKVKENNENQNK